MTAIGDLGFSDGEIRKLFDFWDMDGSGGIDFYECVASGSLLARASFATTTRSFVRSFSLFYLLATHSSTRFFFHSHFSLLVVVIFPSPSPLTHHPSGSPTT
jgi:hypothetical protein